MARSLDVPFVGGSRRMLRARARRERRSLEDAARRGAIRVLRARPAAVRRRRRGARPHARRPGRNVSAAAAPRRRTARAGGDVSAARHDCPPGPRLSPAGVAEIPRRAEDRVRRRRDQRRRRRFRAIASARSSCRSSRIGSTRPSSTCWPTRPSCAREMWAWLESAADEFEKGDGSHFVDRGRSLRATSETTPVPLFRELDVARLKAAPPPLRRLVLWRTMNEAAGGRSVSFGHVEAALQLLEAERGARRCARAPRGTSLVPRLVLTSRAQPDDGQSPGDTSRRAANLFQYPLSIPGEVQLV